MAGCVLRATGSFSPEQFLSQHTFDSQHYSSDDTLIVEVSAASGHHFELQLLEASAFITDNRTTLLALVAYPGVADVYLSFGLWQRDVAAQTVSFPSSLVTAAGTLGIGLVASLYAAEPGNA